MVYTTIYPLNLGICPSSTFFRDRLTICRGRYMVDLSSWSKKLLVVLFTLIQMDILYNMVGVFLCYMKNDSPQPCQFSSSANTNDPSKWDIYCIYGAFSGYIHQYTPSTSAFFRPRPAASDEKMPRFRGYIVGYTPQKHRIYITYIYIYIPVF